jgi:hypothetical protein
VRFIAGLVCGLALAGGACGSTPFTPLPDGDLLAITDGGVVSCTLVEVFDAGQTATLCFEVPANGGQSLEQSCASHDLAAPTVDAGSVTFENKPCSRVDALGGCRTSAYGQIQDQWYYGSGGDSGTSVFNQTASDIMSLCAEMGDAYLAPN